MVANNENTPPDQPDFDEASQKKKVIQSYYFDFTDTF